MDITRESLIKKLLYRSKYRGCRENEYLLYNFAKHNLEFFNNAELIQYEKLLDYEDRDIFSWLSGISSDYPEAFKGLLLKIKYFILECK